MSQVRFLLGARNGDSLSTVLQWMASLPAWAPFDPRAVSFVGRFSQRLLTDTRIRQFPELAVLAHWFRSARLRELSMSYPGELKDALVVGRGLAFHIAPSNVDSMSMYSGLLSLLAGNSNLVRVSQEPSPQLDLVLETLNSVLLEDAGAATVGRLVVTTYPHDEGVTSAICASCMLRVVWGGDATVAAIRAVPLRATATEICFPDRFSMAAISAEELLRASEQDMRKLARGFFNDAFWFAQQACSSPRLLNWIGPPESCDRAQTRFWGAVNSELTARQPENSPAMAMNRLAAAFELAAARVAHPSSVEAALGLPARLSMESAITDHAKALHCGNGLFLEQQFGRLVDLAAQLTDREQTLAVYGFRRAEIRALVDALPPRALDRIVPIGEALSFNPVWDGTDLVQAFTRRITVPQQ